MQSIGISHPFFEVKKQEKREKLKGCFVLFCSVLFDVQVYREFSD